MIDLIPSPLVLEAHDFNSSAGTLLGRIEQKLPLDPPNSEF